MFKPFDSSRLRVHVAFHYMEDRIKYLKAILNEIEHYHFNIIDVVIDTNSDAKRIINDHFNKIDLKYAVHKNLKHPFLLTWQHRISMANVIDNYDYFMYLEDDIRVPYEALQKWIIDSEHLYQNGYLRGFLRVEINSENRLVCTDQVRKASLKDIVYIGNREYYYPENPYQAFWIYSRLQMKEFIKSPTWHDGNHKEWDIRERAAAGMTWRNPTKHATVIPLDEDCHIPQDVIVWHLPNNYAHDKSSPHGKIPVSDLIRIGRYNRPLLRIKNKIRRLIDVIK